MCFGFLYRASYLKVVQPKLYIQHMYSIYGGSGGMLPQENFVKLDPRRSLLRPFFGPNPTTNRNLTHLLCEVQITRNLDLSRSNVPPEVKCLGASYFDVNCSPDTLHKLSAMTPCFEAKCSLLKQIVPLVRGQSVSKQCPGNNLLQSKVSRGQLISKQSVRGTTYFEVGCPGDNLL